MSEHNCPFCGVSLGDSVRAKAPPAPPPSRLSRAALFAFGTGVSVAIPISAVDCVSDGYVNLPPYGHAPLDGGTGDGDQGADGGIDGGYTSDSADSGGNAGDSAGADSGDDSIPDSAMSDAGDH